MDSIVADAVKFFGPPTDGSGMSALIASGIAGQDHVLSKMDKLPPFSPVLSKLMATLADEDVSFVELASLIEKDTVLSGNVLKLVNSAYYGRSGTVNSIRHAVSIIGMVRVRNMVLSLSISKTWSSLKLPNSWSSARFNLHSVAVGIMADLLASNLPVPYSEGAFVGGLLHDIGKLLIAIAAPAEYERVLRRIEDGRTPAESEEETLGFSHGAISAALLEKWKIPKPIQRAVAMHHSPDEADSRQMHLAHVINVADEFVNAAGYPVVKLPAAEDSDPAKALERLDLGPHVPMVVETFQSDFEAIKSFF
jgi:putative nucleotidyltransferase with HDIG domain